MNRGFTLIELAVVLAIIAILAAILTPIVGSYVDEARVARAVVEIRNIGTAIALHQRDTSRYPVYASITATTTDTEVLFGPGPGPLFTGSGWGSPASTSLVTRLNTNFFGLPVTFGSGRIAYHGPYLSNIDLDPWGYSYVVEGGTAPGTSGYAAYVISGGPNGTVETAKAQSPTSFTVSGDDLVYRIK